MANERKTFGFLDRGSPYDDISTVSGYKGGELARIDAFLNREVWIEKMFSFSRNLDHKLVCDTRDDSNRPGSYHACHAEKQLTGASDRVYTEGIYTEGIPHIAHAKPRDH